jgi:hypothetical protein
MRSDSLSDNILCHILYTLIEIVSPKVAIESLPYNHLPLTYACVYQQLSECKIMGRAKIHHLFFYLTLTGVSFKISKVSIVAYM